MSKEATIIEESNEDQLEKIFIAIQGVTKEIQGINDKVNTLELCMKELQLDIVKLKQDTKALQEETEVIETDSGFDAGIFSGGLGLVNTSATAVINGFAGLAKGVVDIITLNGGKSLAK